MKAYFFAVLGVVAVLAGIKVGRDVAARMFTSPDSGSGF
jgi:hypothetical protein